DGSASLSTEDLSWILNEVELVESEFDKYKTQKDAIVAKQQEAHDAKVQAKAEERGLEKAAQESENCGAFWVAKAIRRLIPGEQPAPSQPPATEPGKELEIEVNCPKCCGEGQLGSQLSMSQITCDMCKGYGLIKPSGAEHSDSVSQVAPAAEGAIPSKAPS